MASTTQWFLDRVHDKMREGDRPNLRETERLLRLSERCRALEAALRTDPGHGVTGAVVRPTEDRTKSVSDWRAMGAALLASTGPFEEGACRVCGCTRITACDVETDHGSAACSWVSGTDETLCSAEACVDAAEAAGIVRHESAFDCGICREARCKGHPVAIAPAFVGLLGSISHDGKFVPAPDPGLSPDDRAR